MPRPVLDSEKKIFIAAEGYQESGGNYGAVNPNSGALGKYQVLPSNLSSWLRESGLPQMSAGQYLRNHAAQEQLAWTILGGDYDRYGAAGAAAVWYSGQPDPTKRYGDPPVYEYVANVLAIMRRMGAGDIPIFNPESPGIAPPTEKNWSGHISTARKGILHHSRQVNNYTSVIRYLIYKRPGKV